MLNYNTPLTAEESAFAAEHHHLLLSYLKKARLDFDEFYDIAVFGYLRAVRKYLARPELRAYQFSTCIIHVNTGFAASGAGALCRH